MIFVIISEKVTVFNTCIYKLECIQTAHIVLLTYLENRRSTFIKFVTHLLSIIYILSKFLFVILYQEKTINLNC